jgi:hypothetical protein
MATKEKEQKEGAPKKEKGASRKKGGDRQAEAPKEHTGVGLPVVAPRLKTYYDETIRPKLQKQFGLANIHEIPKLTKIVLNVGAGEAVKQPKILDGIVAELELIAGQRPVRTRAKKSIANFGLRQGQEIGASGDAPWRTDVGVPRSLHDGRRSRAFATSAGWARARSTDAATTRSA